MMSKIVYSILMLMLIGLINTQSFAAIVVDQEHTAFDNWSFLFDPDASFDRPIVGQSFKPGFNNVAAIDIIAAIPTGFTDDNAVITVDVFAAGASPDGQGPTGTSLGSVSKTIAEMTNFNNGLFETFTFGTPIAVTADAQYMFQVTFDDPEDNDSNIRLRLKLSGSYSDGNYIHFDDGIWEYDASGTRPQRELAFRTYSDDSIIPEPASIALLGLGGLLMLTRRQSWI